MKKIILFIFFVCFVITSRGQTSFLSQGVTSNQPSLRGNGMSFTQNKGQISDMNRQPRPDVLYKGNGAGTDIYLRKTGVSYILSNMSEIMHEVDERLEEFEKSGKISDKQKTKEELLSKQILKLHRLDVDFVNCNPITETTTSDQVEGYTNYYYSHCPDGIAHVNTYNQVTVKNIYNNIDIKYYGGKEHGLKYDIIVKPGGDPNQVKLKYSGAEELKIKHGNSSTGLTTRLRIKTSVGDLDEYMPKVYQNINGKIVDVKAEYKLDVKEKSDQTKRSQVYEVSFELGNWDPSFPLIIDPWATYYGGPDGSWPYSITTDPFGNVAFAGYVFSPVFPVTFGAFQTVIGSADNDAFLVKMDANGNRLWATYVGGSKTEYGRGVGTDALGNIYLTGETRSYDFPVGATAGNSVYKNSNVGSANIPDAFLIKFDPSGGRLWATYYGDTDGDNGYGVAADAANNIYLYGETSSTNNIATAGTFQTSFNGNWDVFVAKFSSTGNRIWGTYIGGSNGESCGGIAYDASSVNIYIGGKTLSANFPTFSGHQNAYGGSGDAFLVKLSPAGARIWATYYGGTALDAGSGVTAGTGIVSAAVAVDGSGNVILGTCSFSTGAGVVATAGAYQTAYGGSGTGFGGDVVVVKFNSSGVRQWGTYLGGNKDEWLAGIAVDGKNNIYAYGEAEDSDLGNYPVSTCAYQPAWGGVEDQFIGKLSPVGQLLCSTYIGGTREDDVDLTFKGIVVDGNSLYITGTTNGAYPVTPGAFQTTFVVSNTSDMGIFVNKLCINLCEAKTLSLNFTASTTSVCPNTPVTFTPSINNSCDTTGYKFQWVFTGSTGGNPPNSSAVTPTVTFPSPGNYDVKLILTTACKKDSVIKTTYITVNPCGCTLSAQANKTSNACNGSNGSATVSAGNGSGGNYTYSWSNGTSSITSVTTGSLSDLPAGTYTVTVTNSGCSSTSTVTISNPCVVTASATNTSICNNNCTNISSSGSGGTGPYNYSWNTGGGTQIINVCPTSTTTYTVTVKDATGTTTTTTATVIVNPPVLITDTSSTNISCTTSGSASVLVSNFASPYTYNWSNGFIGRKISTPTAGIYTVTITDANGCNATTVFNIKGSSPVSAAFTFSTVCMGTNVLFTNTGTPPGTGITYNWIVLPNNVSGTSTDFSFTFLTSGTYTVQHTVTQGSCSNTVNQDITIVNCNGPTITATSGSACPGACASVTSNPAGGTGPYTYSWNTGETTQNINPCPASTTTYTVKVTDSGGGTATTTATVTIHPAISITATPILNCGTNNGSVTATVTGGSSSFTYSWSNGITTVTSSLTSQISSLTSNTYSITVTDAKGCSASSSAIIDPPFGAQYIKGTNNCAGCGCKEWIIVTPSNGRAPYTYDWPALGGYDKRYKNQLCSGAYTIKVTDKNGCNVNVLVTAP
jgi:hypothetical protein